MGKEIYGRRAGQGVDDSIIWRMHFAYWIPKATDIHSEYVILLLFSRQQWFLGRAPMLRYSILPVLFIYRK